MSEGDLELLKTSLVKPLPKPDDDTLEEDIRMMDHEARKNLDNAFALVPWSVVRKPNINYIYFKQKRTLLNSIPVDLQLAWYFDNFMTVSHTHRSTSISDVWCN
jgi:hypothetical protein